MLQVHNGGPDGTDGSPAGTPVVGAWSFKRQASTGLIDFELKTLGVKVSGWNARSTKISHDLPINRQRHMHRKHGS